MQTGKPPPQRRCEFLGNKPNLKKLFVYRRLSQPPPHQRVDDGDHSASAAGETASDCQARHANQLRERLHSARRHQETEERNLCGGGWRFTQHLRGTLLDFSALTNPDAYSDTNREDRCLVRGSSNLPLSRPALLDPLKVGWTEPSKDLLRNQARLPSIRIFRDFRRWFEPCQISQESSFA